MDELYEYMNWKLAEMYQNGRGDIHIDMTHAFLIYHLICYMKQIKAIVNQEDDMWNTLKKIMEERNNEI